jgi:hypothetical protein
MYNLGGMPIIDVENVEPNTEDSINIDTPDEAYVN